jgi:hypothetical protein
MADAIGSAAGGGYRQGRRARQQVPRTRRVEVTLTDEEDAVLRAAARRAGLAPAAYAATAALTAARSGPASDPEVRRQALTELMRATGLVRRIATNLHQAAAALTATGQPAGDLPAYAAWTIRRADHIDAVAEDVRKALRQGSR